jgi:hypothetical protein
VYAMWTVELSAQNNLSTVSSSTRLTSEARPAHPEPPVLFFAVQPPGARHASQQPVAALTVVHAHRHTQAHAAAAAGTPHRSRYVSVQACTSSSVAMCDSSSFPWLPSRQGAGSKWAAYDRVPAALSSPTASHTVHTMASCHCNDTPCHCNLPPPLLTCAAPADSATPSNPPACAQQCPCRWQQQQHADHPRPARHPRHQQRRHRQT